MADQVDIASSDMHAVWDRRGAEGSPRRSHRKRSDTAVHTRGAGVTSIAILQPMTSEHGGHWGPELAEPAAAANGLDDLIVRAGRGDEVAFAELYDALSPAVYGLTRRVVRDPAQAEEVTQEVFIDVWRSSPRFDPARGAARSWVLTIAHRRAVDRVRSAQASTDREQRAAQASGSRDFDEVVEAVETRLEVEAVRRCLQALTDLQREAVSLAYYGGQTYAQVATGLGIPLGTIKTRLRDGLIRLRDCLGVTTA